MRTVNMLKLAAATLALSGGLATVATTGFSTSASAGTRTGGASGFASKAQAAIAKKKGAAAVEWAEKAVAGDPQNAAYRFLLGEAYLSAGRFASADTAFSDTLSINPQHDRAALKLALSRIAMGRAPEAVRVLEDNKASISASDYGLALALAGDTANGVRALETAARTPEAGAKVRQNLALAYALNGQWYEARAVAAQDLPLDVVNLRLLEWASFARPAAAWDQVAGLLGVTPAFDAGQPVALALAPSTTVAPYEVAVAEPAPAPLAEVEAYAAPSVASAPVAAFEIPASSAPAMAAAGSGDATPAYYPEAPLIKSDPTPVRVAAVAAPRMRSVAAMAPAKAPARGVAQPAKVSGKGNYVVQLGAFSNAGGAQKAWAVASKRTGNLSGYDHSTTKVTVNKASVYRLAVSGFSSRDDAGRVCTQVRANGGACFVRSAGGDTNVRLAKRGNGTRLAAKRVTGKKVAANRPVAKRSVKIASR